ncbi:MAG TPA: hypothetical protein VHK26_04485 [Methyloceanibacter sp.]|jgi:hypothetical protein|nr:hypothetical protein [Methyloceanibacter sp.]
MLHKFLVVATAVAAIAVSAIPTQPAKAGSCAVVTAEGRGANEAKASARSVKHLTFKTNRWAHKNGYTTVGVAKTATVCATKGPLVHCHSSHKVCG